MKKVLLVVLCAAAIVGCGTKPSCDAKNVTQFIVDSYWSQVGQALPAETFEALKKAASIEIANIKAVETSDVRCLCEGDVVTKITSDSALADLQAIEPMFQKEQMESTVAISYTVTLGEDKKTLTVEAQVQTQE
jgi:hypothetical protein